jgi:hypothetical protein
VLVAASMLVLMLPVRELPAPREEKLRLSCTLAADFPNPRAENQVDLTAAICSEHVCCHGSDTVLEYKYREKWWYAMDDTGQETRAPHSPWAEHLALLLVRATVLGCKYTEQRHVKQAMAKDTGQEMRAPHSL